MLERLYILLDSSWMGFGEMVSPYGRETIYDSDIIKDIDDSPYYYVAYLSTLDEVNDSNNKAIFTTQLDFLSFKHAKRLFILYNDEIHEITLGKCEGTKREIKASHNLKNLLLAGEFDWFNPNEV